MKPARDQSYCETGWHDLCTGYTDDEFDPESCICDCHEHPFEEHP